MLIADVETRLVAMLRKSGVAPGAVTAADVPTLVGVYRRFAAVPVDDAAPAEEDGDGFLAQFGTYAFRGRREFSCDLTRQLIEPGDDPPMWQLSCTVRWTASRSTDALGSGVLWSFGMTLDEFFAQAAALPGWAWALAGSHAPQDLVIELEQV